MHITSQYLIHITSQLSVNSSDGNDERPPDVLLSYDTSIPLDLTREILLRLPAESLVRFRCVWKEWLSITTQPDWPYYCPRDEGSVKADIPFLVDHLRDDHKVDIHSGSPFENCFVDSNPLKVVHATWMFTVNHCFGQYFYLHFEAFQLGMAPVYMAFLRFMGDETEARNYKYSLEVGDDDRKLIWKGTPRSLRDNHRKVRDSHDGLIILRDMALLFSSGDRKELNLTVTGRIWKDE